MDKNDYYTVGDIKMDLIKIMRKKGFILIHVLWVLSFLTVLAVALGMGIRQKISVLQKIDYRMSLRFAAEAGVKKTMAILSEEMENGSFLLTSESRMMLYNTPHLFAQTKVGDFVVDVISHRFSEKEKQVIEFFGVMDEQSKVNVNMADPLTLQVLFQKVLQSSEYEAKSLTASILEWRGDHRQEMSQFLTEGYYRHLEHPYELKKKPFERIDELLLLKGFSQKIFEQLLPFITVYGDGKINVNTTSSVVFEALGLSETTIENILQVRNGHDGVLGTTDDHIFMKPFDMGIDLKSKVNLDEKWIRQIDALNARRLFTTNSVTVSFQVLAMDSQQPQHSKTIDVALDIAKNKILYWNEK